MIPHNFCCDTQHARSCYRICSKSEEAKRERYTEETNVTIILKTFLFLIQSMFSS